MIDHRRRVRRTSHLGKIVVVILGIILLICGYYYFRYQYFISTAVNSSNSEEIVVTIKKGDSTSKIASQLSQKQLILDENSFNWYAKLNGLDKNLKTGRFPLTQAQTIPEILAELSSNEKRQEIVTIPEGSTTEEIDQILTNLQLINSGEFNQSVKNFSNYQKYSFLNAEKQSGLIYPLEGYLFPDTYFVSAAEFDTNTFISLLLNTFKQKALPITQNSERSLSDIINVAAMIEKETNTAADRPIVAGIIWKRLDQKWALGIDATLLYLKDDRSLEYHDLKQDNAYNTRTNPGLPPGPIANPGLSSIKAAVNPEKTDYYFYLTAKDGTMVYAKTNEEHAQNKAKYL